MADGARINGNGTAGSVSRDEGGTIAPRSGTPLAISGNVFLAGGSTYGVMLAKARQSTRLRVRGSVTIAGDAALSLIGVNDRTKAGLRYTLVDADGGSPAVSTFPMIPPFPGLALTYEPNRDYLIAR